MINHVSQVKYILLLSNTLENFKKKQGGTWNFRCPFCGDSSKSKSKSRGYLYIKKDTYKFTCHNCGLNLSFHGFLRAISLPMYNEYLTEKYKNDDANREYQAFKKNVPTRETKFSELKSIASLEENHPARLFLDQRQIPRSNYSNLYYTSTFCQYVNSFYPNKLNEKYEEERIVIPLRFQKSIVGFQGRAIHPVDKQYRYISIILNSELPRLFGGDKVDFNRKFYVTEGPFDSMFLSNAIAVCGSSMIQTIQEIKFEKENATLIFDNEPRNLEICNKIGAAIKRGYRVFIWPSSLPAKDINDNVLLGHTPSKIRSLIDSNTFSGMEAELLFSNWKKVNEESKVNRNNQTSFARI